MATKKSSDQPTSINSIKTTEDKVQYLYKEVFFISDKVQQIFDNQTEIIKLLSSLLSEYKNIKNFDEKFLK